MQSAVKVNFAICAHEGESIEWSYFSHFTGLDRLNTHTCMCQNAHLCKYPCRHRYLGFERKKTCNSVLNPLKSQQSKAAFTLHGSSDPNPKPCKKITLIPISSDWFQASFICGNKSDMNRICEFAPAV